MLKIAIIIGSTRPGRRSETVAKWAYDIARQRGDAEFELLDLADFNLPLLDEPLAAMSGQYSQAHTRAWSVRVASFDGYVFVTPEYNHGVPSALKNAIDFLYREWADKAAGFIGYAYTMGARAIEHLRLVMAAVQVATVRRSDSRCSQILRIPPYSSPRRFRAQISTPCSIRSSLGAARCKL
jgi:NAD(P)H-dependent FMN reductase